MNPIKQSIIALLAITTASFAGPIQKVLKDGELSLTIADGEKLTFLNGGLSNQLSTPIPVWIQVEDPDDPNATLEFASDDSVFYGPLKIAIRPVNVLGEEVDAFMTYTISKTNDSFSPLGNAVIPSDQAGEFLVRLESSEDLDSWANVLPGTYTATESNRFFRVRIVKN